MPPDDDRPEKVDLDGLEDVGGLEESDLPGSGDDSTPSAEQTPQEPVQSETDPLDQVDEAIDKIREGLDTEAARRATESQAREDTWIQLRQLRHDLSDLAPQTGAEAGLVDRARAAVSEAWHAWDEADDLESLDVVADKIKWARQELDTAAGAVPKRLKPPPQDAASLPPTDSVEQLLAEIDQEVDPATKQRLLEEMEELVKEGTADIPKWIDPTTGKPPTRFEPRKIDPLDGSPIGDLQPMEDTRVRRALADRIDRTALPRIRLPIIIGGFGVIGLVLLGFFIFGGSDDAEDPATALPTVTAVETTTPPSTEPVVSTTPPAVALEAPDLSAVPFPAAWSYGTSKTADLIPPPEFLSVASAGTTYTGLLMIDRVCTGGTCMYESTYDLEREFLDAAEVGTRSPATWSTDGATWSVELEAHTMERDDGIDRCVLLQTETWEVTVTEAFLVDGEWVAGAFEGALVRATGLDPEASTAGCTVWSFADQWSVTGVAAG